MEQHLQVARFDFELGTLTAKGPGEAKSARTLLLCHNRGWRHVKNLRLVSARGHRLQVIVL